MVVAFACWCDCVLVVWTGGLVGLMIAFCLSVLREFVCAGCFVL